MSTHAPSPEVQGYLPCQSKLLFASLRLLRGAGSSSIEHTTKADCRQIYAAIGRSSLGEMLFDLSAPRDMEPLSETLGRAPEVGITTVSRVSYGATAQWIRRSRLIKPGHESLYTDRDDVRFYYAPSGGLARVDFSPKVDWHGEVHLTFQHGTNSAQEPVYERLAICDNHNFPGTRPTVNSSLFTNDYAAESMSRSVAGDDEVFALLGIIEDLRSLST